MIKNLIKSNNQSNSSKSVSSLRDFVSKLI